MNAATVSSHRWSRLSESLATLPCDASVAFETAESAVVNLLHHIPGIRQRQALRPNESSALMEIHLSERFTGDTNGEP